MCEYEIPDDVSTEVKDLIQGILNSNINQRLNIAEIKNHPWFIGGDIKLGLQLNFINNPSLGIYQHSVDEGIIKSMLDKNYVFEGCQSREDIVKALQNLKLKEQRMFQVDYEIMLSVKRQDFCFQLESNQFFLGILDEDIKKEISKNTLSECYNKFYQFRESQHSHSHFGLISKRQIRETIQILTSVMNKMNIKLEVEKSERYFFTCFLTHNNVPTSNSFSIKIFDNYDDYVLDFQNLNLGNLKFIILVREIFYNFDNIKGLP